jgi:hypothetical protein
LWNARSSSSCRFTLPESTKQTKKNELATYRTTHQQQTNPAGTDRSTSERRRVALIDFVDGVKDHGALERLDAEAEDAHD